MKQETRPFTTIITITFNLIKANRGKFFRQCLESVHNQTYKNIEHIIVDGASKDGTVDLIKEYSDKGWVKYISEPDTGIYDAMNKGIKLARGKYIAFLNSDDYYHDKTGVASSVNALEESNADFSYAPVIVRFKDGTLFSEHPQCNPKISNVFFTMPFCHQTMFTKREVMIRENMFDANYKSAADYDFVIRLCLKRYKSVFVNNTFVTYQFEGVSSTAQENSLNETADIYFRQYSKLFPITREVSEVMCRNVYTGDYYNGLPSQLAEKFRKYNPYFDYGDYSKRVKTEKESKAKIRPLLRTWCLKFKIFQKNAKQ